MDIAKRGATFFVVLMAFAVFLAIGCKAAEKDGVEYRNNEVSYAAGESCVERYLLYEEDGTYERYIAGMYFGERLPGINFGTLFETGKYTAEAHSGRVTFYPKKQYNPETKNLEYLGLEGQALYYDGTLTDTTLTIMWEVWLSHREKRDVPILYERYR